MKIGLAQINTRVGAIDANTRKVLDYAARARDERGCDLVLFPELTLCGYPPEDLLLHRGLRSRVEAAFAKVRDEVRGIAVYVGYPEYEGDAIYNSAALLARRPRAREPPQGGAAELRGVRREALLPARRRARPSSSSTATSSGLIICEDVWVPEPCRAPAEAGARGRSSSSTARRSTRTQQAAREQVLATRAQENSLPLVYVNMVGGQDELVFDGGSVVVDAQGDVQFRAPLFEEDLYVVEFERKRRPARAARRARRRRCRRSPSACTARSCSARATTSRRTASRASCSGLSGGIDSALTLDDRRRRARARSASTPS